MDYRHICVAALILAVGARLPTAASAQQVLEGEVVLQEVPLALEAPGFYRYVSAYHDGETFYVDITRLFRLLGFEVRHVPPVVEALDASCTYRVNFADGTARRTTSPTTEISLTGEYIAGAGRYYVTIAGLTALFEEDIYFEEERRFLFTTNELAEPGRLYYDAYFGRTQQTHSRVGLAYLQYGLLPRLSARVAGIYYGDTARARIGAAFSPVPFGVVSTDVDLSAGLWRGDVKAWHSRLSLEATYERAPRPSIFQANKHLFRSQLTASWGRLSGFIGVSLTEGFQGWTHRRVSSLLSYYSKGGIAASVELTAQRLHAGSGTPADGYIYRASFGKTFFLPGGSSRLSLFTHGSERRAVGQSGIEGFLSWRRVSLGFSAGYDFHARDFTGGLTLRLDAPFSGFSSRGSYNGSMVSHEETLYGSLELGRRPRLTRNSLQRSSAVIRVFEDLSGDGHYQSNEPLRPEVQVQLYQAGLTRQPDGTLRAGFLQPFTEYQVQLIERSILDPLLVPMTGYTFSFVADPGHTRRIDIPLQHLPVVTGYVRGMKIAPSRLRLLVFKGAEQVDSADLYRDGGFTLRLPPGQYELSLVDVLDRRSFASARQSVFVEPGSMEPLVLELTVEEESDHDNQ